MQWKLLGLLFTKRNVRDFIAERNPPRPENVSMVTTEVKSEEIVGVPKGRGLKDYGEQEAQVRVCYYCKARGHVIRRCFKRMKDEKRQAFGVNCVKPVSKPSIVSSAFVPVDIMGISNYALVDTGAAVSLCIPSVLPQNVNITGSSSIIKGVSGNSLNVKGKARVEAKIGGVNTHLEIQVVESMSDNTFILGRDFLERNECVIDYKRSCLTIGKNDIPLLKTYEGNRSRGDVAVICRKTVVIPPNSSKLLECHLKGKNNRIYWSTTGAVEVCDNLLKQVPLSSRDCLQNSRRGNVSVLLCNSGDLPVTVYRSKKVASFTSIHCSAVNQVHMTPGYETPAPDNKSPWGRLPGQREQSDTAARNMSSDLSSEKRWPDINRLFELLKLDELSQ